VTKLILDSDQRQMLTDSAQRFVERGYDAAVRNRSLAHADGCLPEVWQQFAELGWLALAVPEAQGGFGGLAADLCAVALALGQGAVNEPFVACGVRLPALLAGLPLDDTATLAAVTTGQRRLALVPGDGLVTRASDGQWRLDGSSRVIQGGAGADAWLLALPLNPGVVALWSLDAGLAGLRAEPCTLIDGERGLRLHADALLLPAPLWQGPATVWDDALTAADRLALISHGALAVGSMRKALDITLAYTRTRRQFGHAVAQNQVVQHRLVDLLVEIEETQALVLETAARLDAGLPDPRWLSAAAATVAATARHCWQETVQLHGAIGMTQDCEAAAYVKRLALASTLFGTEATHLAQLAACSLGPLQAGVHQPA
jgi:alkylation response protein AidB-like acyl-CoA dehydrogenase